MNTIVTMFQNALKKCRDRPRNQAPAAEKAVPLFKKTKDGQWVPNEEFDKELEQRMDELDPAWRRRRQETGGFISS